MEHGNFVFKLGLQFPNFNQCNFRPTLKWILFQKMMHQKLKVTRILWIWRKDLNIFLLQYIYWHNFLRKSAAFFSKDAMIDSNMVKSENWVFIRLSNSWRRRWISLSLTSSWCLRFDNSDCKASFFFPEFSAVVTFKDKNQSDFVKIYENVCILITFSFFLITISRKYFKIICRGLLSLR